MRLSTGLLIQFLFLFGLFITCEKEPKIRENCNPLNFISLEAENDTITSGTETRITAVAEGDGLTYEWTKSLGIIEGSGYQVTYNATPCAIGEIEVTCKIIDECGNSESMTIKIYVI